MYDQNINENIQRFKKCFPRNTNCIFLRIYSRYHISIDFHDICFERFSKKQVKVFAFLQKLSTTQKASSSVNVIKSHNTALSDTLNIIYCVLQFYILTSYFHSFIHFWKCSKLSFHNNWDMRQSPRDTKSDTETWKLTIQFLVILQISTQWKLGSIERARPDLLIHLTQINCLRY